MPYVIVKKKASAEYSYWPGERGKELPQDYEIHKEKGNSVEFERLEEAVQWVQEKHAQLTEKNNKKKSSDSE